MRGTLAYDMAVAACAMRDLSGTVARRTGDLWRLWLFSSAGSKVLYLGAASGTSVSHVSDIVGPEGAVYAVEFSHRSGRDLVNMAKKRPNVIPIIEDARHPQKYRMLVPMVDVVFADVAQPDQVRARSWCPLKGREGREGSRGSVGVGELEPERIWIWGLVPRGVCGVA